jgi:anhydro-N-acetylmuramic acid kinase
VSEAVGPTRVLGMLSGTSHDAIDLLVVEFTSEGEQLVADLVWGGSRPFPDALRAELVRALPPGVSRMADVCRLDVWLGQEFADAAAWAAESSGGFDVACSHGQTMFHGVEAGTVWGTLQLGQAAWIAEACGVPVVSDVRTRDVAAGGQGAPLVSLLDVLLARDDAATAFVNLGGIANVTAVRPDGAVQAFDIGPANALIDAAMATHPTSPAAYDAGGRSAARGRVDDQVLAALLTEPYLRRDAPKTTGKELFNAAYVERHGGGLVGDDLVATLTAFTVRSVADAVRALNSGRVICSGGGTNNPVLMDGLAGHLDPIPVVTSQVLGIPGDLKEALAFALLGWHTYHRLPASVPGATGARGSRVLGSITPVEDKPDRGPSVPLPQRLTVRNELGNAQP